MANRLLEITTIQLIYSTASGNAMSTNIRGSDTCCSADTTKDN